MIDYKSKKQRYKMNKMTKSKKLWTELNKYKNSYKITIQISSILINIKQQSRIIYKKIQNKSIQQIKDLYKRNRKYKSKLKIMINAQKWKI